MSSQVAVLLFGLGSVAALASSWSSLRHPRSHGVPRFFAFECILGILVLNLPAWFSHPLATLQLVSWFLLAVSAIVALAAFIVLHERGRPGPPPAGSPLHRFEATSTLVTVGPYRWLRHPLYAALAFLAWGAALKTASPASLGLAIAASGLVTATALVEERENLERFGSAYQEYMRHTKRFVPGIW